MDNAFAAVQDPAGSQQICDRLGPVQIQALLDKWLAILPTRSPRRTPTPVTGINCRSSRPSSP